MGAPARQELIEQRAEAVHVGRRRDRRRRFVELRGGVGRREQANPGPRQRERVGVVATRRPRVVEEFRDPEVEDDGPRPRAPPWAVALGDEDVRRLEVAVDDEPAVGVVDGPSHLDHEPHPIADAEVAGIGVGRDRLAVDELRDEVWHPIGALAAVE